MASSGKKKTTMAKLTRESRLRQRRMDKKAKKDARKLAPALDPDSPEGILDPTSDEVLDAATDETAEAGLAQPPLEAVMQTLADA